MAITVKKVSLWRCETENRPGALERVVEPLAKAGADLRVLMAYRFPGNETRAAIELFPITGKRLTAAAEAAGMKPANIPALLVEGDNERGLGAATSKAIADAGINLGFVVVQVIGRKYSAIYGFESEADVRRGATIIKRVGSRRRKK